MCSVDGTDLCYSDLTFKASLFLEYVDVILPNRSWAKHNLQNCGNSNMKLFQKIGIQIQLAYSLNRSNSRNLGYTI
jgi:hypothetical protein